MTTEKKTRNVKPIMGFYHRTNIAAEESYEPVGNWPKGVTDMDEAAKIAAEIQWSAVEEGREVQPITFMRVLGTASTEVRKVGKFKLS